MLNLGSWLLLLQAERVRFELTVTHTSHNGFRDRPIQPLWHLSARGKFYRMEEVMGIV